jgi:mono/diheme cytochrome c family protein
MTSARKDGNLPITACGCLLLPTFSCFFLLSPVLVLLLAISSTPVSGRVPVVSSSSQPLTVTRAAAARSQTAVSAKVETLLPSADPANGNKLFNTFQPAVGIACATCHRVDSEERLVGPGLFNVGKRAETRIAGMGAVAYLRQSIVSPSAYIVAGYTDIMAKNWGRVLSEKQIDDLVAYLLTLKSP